MLEMTDKDDHSSGLDIENLKRIIAEYKPNQEDISKE